MKHSGPFSIRVQILPHLEKALHYGLLALAFCLLFVNLYNVSEYLFFVLLIIWLLKIPLTGSYGFNKTSLDIPILLFLCWILLTAPFATDWAYSIEEWRKAIPRFLIFWLVVHVVKSEQHVRAILLSVSVGLFSLAFVESMYFFVEGGDPLSMERRAGSFTGSSQWLSYYLVMGVPILILGVCCDARPMARWLYITAMGVTVVALFLVHTRAAWLAVVAQALFFVVWKCTRNWMFASVGVVLCVVLVLGSLLLPGKHRELISASEFTQFDSMSNRFNTWAVAVDDILEHPLTGIGYGKHSFQRKHPNLGEEFHAHIHNAFLGRAVQIGIPGFLFFSWIFWVILKKSSAWYKRFSNQYLGNLALAVFLMTMGLIVRSQFDDMFIGSVVYLFMFLSGVCFGPYVHLGQKVVKEA